METAPKHFTEKDAEKLVGLLNFIAKNAKFKELDTEQILGYVKLLNWAQVDLLPKVQANIFEIIAVREAVNGKKK